MTPNFIDANALAPQAWRNGGGRTRELLAWPDARAWSLRISVAEIEADGPFSDFAGIERWFAVIDGAGVALRFDAAELRVLPGDAPLRFDGSLGPQCRMLAGPTRDLNLMLRGASGLMQRVEPGVAWPAAFGFNALYTDVGGVWRCAGIDRELAAATLLWSDAPGASAWTFDPSPQVAAPAWWLGASAPTVVR